MEDSKELIMRPDIRSDFYKSGELQPNITTG
jgi:hypothetical protein